VPLPLENVVLLSSELQLFPPQVPHGPRNWFLGADSSTSKLRACCFRISGITL